jgi:anthranilate synthase component 1
MDFNEFERYAERGNLIPVYREMLADTETPVSVLSRFAADDNVFLLESVEGGERFGRYSFIGVRPRKIFTVENGEAFLAAGNEKLPVGRGIMALRKVMSGIRAVEVPGLPPLFGGAIGYLGYETINDFEELPQPVTPPPGATDALLIVDDMMIFDNLRHTVKLVACAHTGEFPTLRDAYDDAVRRIEVLEDILRTPARIAAEPPVELPRPESNMSREEFCAMVDKARAAIRAGEAIQIVLSQRFTLPSVSSPLQLYRALRLVNPSPYTFFFKQGGTVLIGSSPETMVKLENGCSSLRPIAGTRRRGKTPEEDKRLEEELLRDPKECAEHLMLVDLGRNDLGRVAAPGSVEVRRFMNVERYSHVMHIVSDVEARLAQGCDAFDLVKATFPAGTLSGAPKVRAMELIHDFEPVSRGVYGGAIGYFSYTGNLDLAITIRTLEMRDGKISVQAGAGIVFDSEPDKEYEETLNKAAAIFKTVELAANGLRIEQSGVAK